MEKAALKKDVISRLRKDILLLEGYKPPLTGNSNAIGLGLIEDAFPNAVFPRGSIHEFLCDQPEHAAASGGFISGLLKSLMKQGGACLWIGLSRTIFPPALKAFGVEPDRIIFIDLKRERDVLWVMEEAIKCEGLAAVIAEIEAVSFTESRRLQLAVEKSRVTGFIVRNDLQKLSSTACAARWKITPLPSEIDNGLPGVGFPKWNVELLKVKNGNPGEWKMEWSDQGFRPSREKALNAPLKQTERKAG